MNENLKIVLMIIGAMLILASCIIFITLFPLLEDKLTYMTVGDSPIHSCESKGGTYSKQPFENPKCYIGEEIYDIYNNNGEYKLAK